MKLIIEASDVTTWRAIYNTHHDLRVITAAVDDVIFNK